MIYQNPTRKVADEGTEATEGAAAPNILVAGLMILVRVVLFGPARFFLILANFGCSNKKRSVQKEKRHLFRTFDHCFDISAHSALGMY